MSERDIAEAAGYLDPYPAPGIAPVADIEEDRCVGCGWTLYVSLECAVFCINEKCKQHHEDLTKEEPDADRADP